MEGLTERDSDSERDEHQHRNEEARVSAAPPPVTFSARAQGSKSSAPRE